MATLGLLGLQWSGVTTTLRCLCGSSVAADGGQGVAEVRDPRLGRLAEVSESVKVAARSATRTGSASAEVGSRT